MFRTFEFRAQRLILALGLILIGLISIFAFERTGLTIAGKNFTSIGILIAGLIFYAAVAAL